MVIDPQIQLKEHFGHYIPCHFYLPISRAQIISWKYNILEGLTIRKETENRKIAVICLGQSPGEMQQSKKMTNPENSLKRTNGQ